MAFQGNLKSRPSFKSANGKPQREYLLSSLPAKAQLKYAEMQLRRQVTNLPGEDSTPDRRSNRTTGDVRQESLFASGPGKGRSSVDPAPQREPASTGARLANGPTGPSQGQAQVAAPAPGPGEVYQETPLERIARAAVPEYMQPLVDARYAAIAPMLHIAAKAHARPGEFAEMAKLLARQSPTMPAGKFSERTLWRWYSKFRDAAKKGENPWVAICDRQRRDAEKSKLLPEGSLAALFVHEKYTVERITNARLVYEALCREWPQRFATRQQPDPPCYHTIRVFLNKLPRPLQTLAHRGPRTFVNQHGPYITRNLDGVAAMDWWVLDNRERDMQCRNTLFTEYAPNAAYRIWITAILDMGSRAWMGYCFAPIPSWRTIGSALRRAIGEFGFPQDYYWDNGEDFKKVQRMMAGSDLVTGKRPGIDGTGIDERFGTVIEGMLTGAGCVTRALPYNAKAKMIESHFSIMSRRDDLIYGDAYQGRSPQHRNEYHVEAMKSHKQFLLGKRADSPLPTDVEVIAGTLAWMQRENNRPRKMLGGRSPLQVLQEQCPQPQRPAGRDLLNVLFCERDLRTIGRAGEIRLDNRVYEPADEATLRMMSYYEGQGEKKALILRDPYALEEAVALHADSMKLLGNLQLKEFVGQCPGGHLTRDAIRANARKVGHLKKMYSGYLGFLLAMAQSQGWKTERQVLLEEAGFGGQIATAAPGANALPPAVLQRAKVAAPQSPEDFIESFSEKEGE